MLSLTQKQSQQQRLTPQQLQYLKLLQLSGIALEQRVKEELEVNPLLEEIEEPGSREESLQGEEGTKDDVEWDELMAGTWDPYRSTGSSNAEAIDIPQPAEESLVDRLLAQLRMAPLSQMDVILAEEILGNVDGDGYLRRDLQEIVGDLNRFVSETDLAGLSTDESSDPDSFSSYEMTIIDQPFGRDRILSGDVVPDQVDHLENGKVREPDPGTERDESIEGDAEDPVPAAMRERTIADLSLEEMAELPIEELARILERGTTPPVAATEELNASSAEDAVSADEIAPPEYFSLEDAERLLKLIQRLDPPGVGSRSLQENLAIQLELIDNPTPDQLLARRVIEEAYREFTMKHFPKICRLLDCTEEELKNAIDEITTLNPKPGDGNSGMIETNYVTPDFVIERDGDEFLILPNDSFIPSLRINPGYRDMLGKKGRKRANVDRGTQKFLRQKMESAKWFIASIHQRRQTMLRVMEAILEMQVEFFRHGPNGLKPMIYRDIAEKIGMDISTVCRVVNGKYVQTDFGVFELRYFFSEALETAWGEEVSNKVVKTRIREMIQSEDKSKPLSDEAISEKMKSDGYTIARRTVAKYREQMNIPIARLRRSL